MTRTWSKTTTISSPHSLLSFWRTHLCSPLWSLSLIIASSFSRRMFTTTQTLTSLLLSISLAKRYHHIYPWLNTLPYREDVFEISRIRSRENLGKKQDTKWSWLCTGRKTRRRWRWWSWTHSYSPIKCQCSSMYGRPRSHTSTSWSD